MIGVYDVPRVELPDATEEQSAAIAEFRELMAFRQRQSTMFLQALVLKGRPFTGVRKRKPAPTANQSYAAKMRVRSAYLKGI